MAGYIPDGILALFNGEMPNMQQYEMGGGNPRTAQLARMVGQTPAPQIQQTPMAAPQMGAPVAPRGPGAVAGPTMAPPQGLFDRLRNMLMPDQSGGYLSPDELANARHRGLLDLGLSMLASSHGQGGGNAPSFGQALLGAVDHARQTYGAESDKAVQSKLFGQQLGMSQHMLAGRQAIGQFLQQSVKGSPDDQMNAMKQAYMMATALGDTELAKSLEGVVTKGIETGNAPPMQVSAGGDTMILDPHSLAVRGVVHHSPTPVDPSVAEDRAARLQMAIEEAKARGDTRAAMELQQQASRENGIVDNYRNDPDIKYGTSVAQVAGQLNALRQRALALDPFAQYQALEAALRLRNPEMNRPPNPADYATLAKSMGFTGKLKRDLENFKQGTILPREAMERLYQTSDEMVNQGRTRYSAARQAHLLRAQHYKVDAEALPDAFGTVQAPPTARPNYNPLLGR